MTNYPKKFMHDIKSQIDTKKINNKVSYALKTNKAPLTAFL